MKRLLISILSVVLFAESAQAMESASKKFGNRSGEELRNYLGSELHSAARLKNTDRLKELIAGGADVNYEVDCGFGPESALSEAVSSGNKEAAELLIKAGANLFWHGKWKWTILSRTDRNLPSESLAELIVEKMLKLPDEKQKERIYTFMHCMKCMYHRTKYSQFKDVFKNALRAMIREENAPKVLAQIKALSFYKQKKYLLKKYFPGEPIPAKERGFRLCGGPRME